MRGRDCQWVSGHFDPLLAEHVRRLRQLAAPGRLLVVEVTNPVRPILAQQARAELVAALAMVDQVVLGNGASSAHTADAGISERFVEHVLERHGAEGTK